MNFVIEFGYMTTQGEYVSNPVYIVRGSSCSLLKGSEGGWGVRRALSNFWERPIWKPSLAQRRLKIKAKLNMGPLSAHSCLFLSKPQPNVRFIQIYEQRILIFFFQTIESMIFQKKRRKFTFLCFSCVISTSFQTSLSSPILLKSLKSVWILW